MRNYAISLKGSTQQQRQELYDFLVAKGEPIYPTTELTKSSYTCSYFEFGTKWGGAFDTYFTIISIPGFIAKFQEPKLNIRDYCITCTDSTLAERRQVINYLKSISEDVYSGTAFKDDTDLKGEIFGYDEDSQEWIAGAEEADHILTTKEFIAKFINTGDVMSTIKVGDVYKNSMGKICTILNNSESSNIMCKHEDGKNFTTSSSNITKNWTKQPTSNIKPRGRPRKAATTIGIQRPLK